jgi:hypothetical protein
MRASVVLLILATLATTLGCGGSVTSQADMQRYAIRRSTDDEESPVAAVTPAVAGRLERAGQSDQSDGSDESDRSDGSDGSDVLPAPTAVPDEPLADPERRQRSIDNLQKISAAFQKYLSENRCLPAPAIYDSTRRPLLSWRVQLLPYLGHEKLYSHFRLNEAWDSPHNRQLLPAIPPEYQSPERFDDRTNYLVPAGSGTAFPGPQGFGQHGLMLSSIEDGPANTVILVEADDSAAVPWTQPLDHELDMGGPGTHVGVLRDGVFYLIWGDGTVGQCSLDAARPFWRKMFCVDDGEGFLASLVHQPPSAESLDASAEPDLAELASEPIRDRSADALPATDPSTAPNGTVMPLDPEEMGTSAAAAVTLPFRRPVPDESACEGARQVLRNTYQSQYERARTAEERRALARALLDHTGRLEYGSAERYVALELCWKIAIEAGDLATALQAAEKTSEHFETDPLETKTTVLAATARTRLPSEANQLLLKVANQLIDAAVGEDRFDIARQIQAAAAAAARRSGDRRAIADVTARQREIDDAKTALERASLAVERLTEDPTDAAANRIAGVYYCFAKERWDDGLPMLARGDDLPIAQLARIELTRPVEADRQVALADAWWNEAETRSDFRGAIRRRAGFWYQLALTALPPGLDKLRAEMRLRQVRDAE